VTECPPTDFDGEWNDLQLVTPRHAVQAEWNNAAVEQHCGRSKQQMFICKAGDTIRDRLLMIAERYAVVLRDQGQKGRQRPWNDLDITNSAHGTIIDIILNTDEPSLPNQNIVDLVHLPFYILVQLDRTRVTQLEGLPPGVIPIAKSFTINVMVDRKSQPHTVKRRQFPMTAAYA